MSTHPRFLLVVVAALFGFTGFATALYPPGYLGYPYLWALLALAASTTSALAAFRPSRTIVVLCGTVATAAAGVRAMAIATQVLLDPQPVPVRWSFWLAATTWLAVAILLHALWSHVILPWASFKRMAE